jgi:type I restriction enzyme M protein
MEKNIKNIRNEFKEKGIFYTPEALALTLKQYIDKDVKNVYDPTCGQGNLLKVFPDNIPKYGQELYSDEVDKAINTLSNFKGVCGDTLQNPAFLNKKFDCIVANYPFSIKWEPFTDERFVQAPTIPTQGKADYAFILHILHYLADDGIASVLNFPGILYRGQKEAQIRQWIVDQNYIDKIIHIPANTFVDTKIATVLIVFKKNKTTTDILFVDKELQIDRIVPIEEIIQNNYVLSVSQYIQKQEEKKEITQYDLEAIRNKARQDAIKMIIADLELDKLVCQLEGYNFETYRQQLIQAILDVEPLSNPSPTPLETEER